MKRIFAIGMLAVGLCGCEKPVVEEKMAQVPPAAVMTGVEEATETVAPADGMVGVEPNEVVETATAVDLDPAAIENARVKEEVLKRIDLMPKLSPEDKDRFYVQVDRARAMGKVITIPFKSGETRISAARATELGESLQLEQVQALTGDPTVVFVVLGFADKKGDPEVNRKISLERAESALEVMRDRFDLLNVMHAVGMGSSEMFDAEDLDKNRVVEVWAVVP